MNNDANFDRNMYLNNRFIQIPTTPNLYPSKRVALE